MNILRNRWAFIAALLLAAPLFAPAGVGQQNTANRAAAEIFAILPDGSTGPEGLTVGADGNVYVATFGFNQNGGVSGPGQLFVFNPEGRLLHQVSIAGSSPHLLGLAFHPTTGALLVIDFGAGKVLKVNPLNGASSVFMTVTGNSGLNALTFDQAGNVYVSDSFQGIIWKTGPGGGAGTTWVSDPLLSTTGIPPFGANGVATTRRPRCSWLTPEMTPWCKSRSPTEIRGPLACSSTASMAQTVSRLIAMTISGWLPIRAMRSWWSVPAGSSSQSWGTSKALTIMACPTDCFSRRVQRSAATASFCM